MKLLGFNGPNLNLLGQREPAVYGCATLADVEQLCRETGARLGLEVDCRQTNHEGRLVDWLHEAGVAHREGTLAGVVLNAGAYTHTSVALLSPQPHWLVALGFWKANFSLRPSRT